LFIVADFNLLSSTVLFDSSFGQKSVFVVNITDDTKYEPKDSSFIITLDIPENAELLGVALGENNTATISIIDNDS